jgi:glycosyltransferase involved in cell wall biosynthesis
VKTGQINLSVVQVNYAFDNELTDPDALLDRYTTLTGWAEALAAAGARQSAVVQRFHRPAQLTRNGIDYVFVTGRTGAAVAHFSPDVTHVNGIVFPVRTAIVRARLPPRTAVVVQSHSDGGAIGRAPALRVAGRLCRPAVDAFLFAAVEHAAEWRRAGLVGADQRTYTIMPASTIFHPVAFDLARRQTAIAGSPALLWVGRLNPNKDPLTVLTAFEACLPALPDATLTMVFGTDELLDVVRGRIDGSPALRGRVRLIGAVAHEQMPFYFSAADLFVVGSHHEGSGYALLEAMACGATPVVTDIPTFRLLTGGAIGRLFTPGDSSGCARAIFDAARIAREPAERRRIIDHFDRHDSWIAIGRRALEIYADVIEARRADARRPAPGATP